MAIPPCVSPTAIGCTLVQMAARALSGRDCRDLPIATVVGTAPQAESGWTWLPWAGVVPADRIADIGPDQVALWFVRQYAGARSYPGVVLGSPHGSAALLAVAMGMPWLPTGFRLDVRWPDDAFDDLGAVMRRGQQVEQELTRRFPGVSVTHVHDPVRLGRLTGRQTIHHVRWLEPPAAYAGFLAGQLEPEAPIVIANDVRRWYDHRTVAGLQIGTPAAGLTAEEYLDWLVVMSPAVAHASRADLRPGADVPAERGVEPGLVKAVVERGIQDGRPVHTVNYRAPSALSAAVADTYRAWLCAAGKSGTRLVVSCGRLVDAFQIMRAGLVPYWCERATLAELDALELWLAGSEPYTSIELLPDTVNQEWPGIAGLERWSRVGAFASRRSRIDPHFRRAIDFTDAPALASAVLRHHPGDLPVPNRMTIDHALATIDESPLGERDVYRA